MQSTGEALMFEKISIMRVASLMARHATSRQSTISQNIANADTPNYRAKDIVSFSETIGGSGFSSAVQTTRPGHMRMENRDGIHWRSAEDSSEQKPNRNTVSIEHEILKSIEVEREHSQALSIYQNSIDLLKTSIGRGR
jgi:flagellar basal-body rod protein FlgB